MPKLTSIADWIELLSVFLLSVEAIKLDNLIKVRDRLAGLHRFGRFVQQVSFGRFLQQVIKDLPEISNADEPVRNSVGLLLMVVVVLPGIVAISLLLLVLGYRFDDIGAFHTQVHDVLLRVTKSEEAASTSSTVVLLIAYFSSCIAGFFTWVVGLAGLNFIIHIISWIERNTTTGVVGIIGFLAYCINFALKMAAEH